MPTYTIDAGESRGLLNCGEFTEICLCEHFQDPVVSIADHMKPVIQLSQSMAKIPVSGLSFEQRYGAVSRKVIAYPLIAFACRKKKMAFKKSFVFSANDSGTQKWLVIVSLDD
jgi:hypothetical protein